MIDSFFGEYRFLSNFWPCEVVFEGRTYPSVEHAYVAAKTLVPDERAGVLECATAGKVKRYGKGVTLRADWDKVKLNIMRELVRQKFTMDPELRARLLATAPSEIIEGNTWGDTYWGVCNGRGRNELGKLLMWMRDVCIPAQDLLYNGEDI